MKDFEEKLIEEEHKLVEIKILNHETNKRKTIAIEHSLLKDDCDKAIKFIINSIKEVMNP